jgi:hypothetical protein
MKTTKIFFLSHNHVERRTFALFKSVGQKNCPSLRSLFVFLSLWGNSTMLASFALTQMYAAWSELWEL